MTREKHKPYSRNKNYKEACMLKRLMSNLFWCSIGCVNTMIILLGLSAYNDISKKFNLDKANNSESKES